MKNNKDTVEDRLMFGGKNIGGTVLISLLISIVAVLLVLFLGGISHQIINEYKTVNYNVFYNIGSGRTDGQSQTILIGVAACAIDCYIADEHLYIDYKAYQVN